ncbi:hypothetical protein BSR28_07665 [Boudabousia liubingyangii]|uniref:hypothetical protein n=1 Tax=Boudabousia liubingyangii TaxID=1921764 RepID=UPI00093EAD53|nr:hypothetical protein [Boudabousia liubingyangii]OKL46394.1 hypothetical protein BSR28_07665 [Boudabousia liubingyangii]
MSSDFMDYDPASFDDQNYQPREELPQDSRATLPIIPLRPLRFGEVVRGTFLALLRNPLVIIFLGLLVGIINSLSSYLTQSKQWEDKFFNQIWIPLAEGKQTTNGPEFQTIIKGFFQSSLINFCVSLLVMVFISGTIAFVVSRLLLFRKANLGETLKATGKAIPALIFIIFVHLLMMAAVLGSVFLLTNLLTDSQGRLTPEKIGLVSLALFAAMIIIVYIELKLLFAPAAAVLEGSKPIEAIKRSWDLSRGLNLINLFTTIVTAVMATLAAFLVAVVLTLIQNLITQMISNPALASSLEILNELLLQAVFSPLVPITWCLLYVNARFIKEDFWRQLPQK